MVPLAYQETRYNQLSYKTLNREDSMIEVGMIVSLVAMGIYFFKSTDLPKELQERSAQYRTQESATRQMTFKNVKITLPKETLNDASFELSELKLQKQLKEIQVLNIEIDKLTLEITTLEQEIKANNTRNAEIQTIINTKLISLQSLHERVSSLA